MITKDISIEERVQKVPASVTYLMEKGIKCLACGELYGGLSKALPGKKDLMILR